LRRQALGWLRADLAAWAAKATSDDPAERKKAAFALGIWLGDGEEFGVGPGKAPDGLPADEQSAWDALWADVRAARVRARKPVPAAPPAPKAATAGGLGSASTGRIGLPDLKSKGGRGSVFGPRATGPPPSARGPKTEPLPPNRFALGH